MNQVDLSVKKENSRLFVDSQTANRLSEWRPWAIYVGQFILGAMFVASAVAKLRHPYDFLYAVYDYELVGATFGLQVARWLPWIELAAGISLIGNVLARGGLLLVACLLGVFTFARLSVVVRDKQIPCGCYLKSNPLDYVTVTDVATSAILCVFAAALWVSLVRFGDGLAQNSNSGESATQ